MSVIATTVAGQPRLWRPVATLVGIVLLTAAGLKLAGGSSRVLDQNHVLFAPAIRVLTVEVELLIGLWLLSGWQAIAARRAALAFFSTLAGVSLWLVWQGQSSCGCLGRITVHPWTTFVADAVAVGLLTAVRPGACAEPWLRLGDAVRVAWGAALLSVLTATGTMAYWGVGPNDALARLKGEALTVEPTITDLGQGVSGERYPFELRLTNRSGRMVTVVGGPSSCACGIDSELPLAVNPGQTVVVSMWSKFAGTPGAFRNKYELYTDAPGQWAVTVRVTGVVTKPR
ncbi:MAG: hypothetical protein U0746_03800 [Gemmataceae bacterium]